MCTATLFEGSDAAAAKAIEGITEMTPMRFATESLVALCITLGSAAYEERAIATEMPEKHGIFTGNDVYSWCKNTRPLAQAYAAGMWDVTARTWGLLYDFKTDAPTAVNTSLGMISDQLANFCEPPGIIVEQVTDVFCSFLRDTPER